MLTEEQAKKKSATDIDLFKCKRVPMQVQLSYTGRDGSKYLQIITDWRELTQNKDDIYNAANFGLFAASVLQNASINIKNE